MALKQERLRIPAAKMMTTMTKSLLSKDHCPGLSEFFFNMMIQLKEFSVQVRDLQTSYACYQLMGWGNEISLDYCKRGINEINSINTSYICYAKDHVLT